MTAENRLYRLEARFIPPARIRLTPESATNPVNTMHTLQAAVEGDHPLNNVAVTFTVTAGPNNGTSATAPTDSVGHANFSYVGSGGPGVDSITARFVSSHGMTLVSNTARKEWIVTGDTYCYHYKNESVPESCVRHQIWVP